MTLEELLKLVPAENAEAVEAFIKEFTDKIANMTTEIKELEGKANDTETKDKLDDAIKKRDAAKAQLKVVRDTLGLPNDKEITPELVKEHTDDASKGDAEKDKKITALNEDKTALQAEMDKLKGEKAEVEKERDAVAEETKFVKVFAENMPSFKPVAEHARSQIEGLMRQGAVLEEGAICYKDAQGGYERVDGERMTMKTRMIGLQENEATSYLFETKASGGSGSSNEGGGSGTGSRFERRKAVAGIK